VQCAGIRRGGAGAGRGGRVKVVGAAQADEVRVAQMVGPLAGGGVGEVVATME